MNKTALFIVILLLAFSSASAQKKLTLKDIQQNPEYIYGTGSGSTINEASQRALEELVSSISTSVESSYDYIMVSEQVNNEFNTKVDVKSMVKTYSKMTLNNTKQLILSNDKDKVKTVVRYITRADLQDMFDKRSEKVKNYVKIARRAAKNNEVGKALQNYYWAMALLLSYPDGNLLQIEDDDYNMQYAYSWIPGQMKALLKNISITPKTAVEDKEAEEKIVTVEVTYCGQPSIDLSFTCSDGEIKETDVISVKNGKGEIYLPLDTKEKKLAAHINYFGRDEAGFDPELADVIDAAAFLRFNDASIKFGRDIELTQKKPKNNKNHNAERQVAQNTPTTEYRPSNLSAQVSQPAQPAKSLQPITAESKLYAYRGETEKGKPEGKGVMTFKASGTFDGIEVENGDYLEGDFFDGHIYIVNHYDKDGNMKHKNIIKAM